MVILIVEECGMRVSLKMKQKVSLIKIFNTPSWNMYRTLNFFEATLILFLFYTRFMHRKNNGFFEIKTY